MAERYVYKYTAYLTATNTPQPISAEWGEDEDCDYVDIVNPLYALTAGTTSGAATAAGAANNGDILTGNRNSQNRPFLPGGNTGIVGVNKLSDMWVRTRTANDSFRILIDVYKRKNEDDEQA